MMASWHPDCDATPNPGEVDMMACALEGRHGTAAEGVAQFFIDWNAQHGDAGRSWAWAAVAECIRQRMSRRVSGEREIRRTENTSARRSR